MAARRAPAVCLACQARQVRRRVAAGRHARGMEMMACAASDADLAAGMRPAAAAAAARRQRMDETDRKQTARAIAVAGVLPAWTLEADPPPTPDMKEAYQALRALWRERDKRIAVLDTLSNPWPEQRSVRGHNEKRNAKLELPEANAAIIPHDVFRVRLREASGDKHARQILRAQLLRCDTPHSILKVVAYSLMLNRQTRLHIAALHEPIMRALYRCRNNVNDMEVLKTLTAIHGRFRDYRVPFDPQLLVLGLKFAARVRSLRYMKKYLKAMRESGMGMTSNVFRATIAKFSIGHRGLGEIRNGRWRKDELLEVCTGFSDCAALPPEGQFHLGTFLDRNDWQFLHGWIAVLARCRHSSAVWEEWLLWKESEARIKPKNLASQSPLMTTKTRGDYWFLEQMAYSGGLREAWCIFEETEMDFATLKDRISNKLIDGLGHCPPAVWRKQSKAITDKMLNKCHVDLSRIERAFGVAWSPVDGNDEGQGFQVNFEDEETVLERLSAEDFKVEEDFGYPHDGGDGERIVPYKEKGLHDATEV